ncbi:Type IV secretion system protein virB10 [Piscirickettsia salmonis]|uniref:TrbI/VirB10 family protein n=1 Tax=Piscirickettsia salmonis TaxID=1238 RepID=UPI001E3D896E|nr:TrbI/VirB10 family protein [Piscirickettsia salmonis]QGP51926.1 Type IV secretion system protein virB10 [Piscirickettsia salmonis]
MMGGRCRQAILKKSICLGLAASLIVPSFFAATPAQDRAGNNNVLDKEASQNINHLPGYHQAKEINHLLDRNQDPKYVEQVPVEIRQELQALRASQQQLMEQLSRLKNRPNRAAQQYRPMTQMDQEAASSAIFFAGGAPRLQQQSFTHPSRQSSKASTASQNGQQSSKNEKLSQPQKQINFLDQDAKDDTQSKHVMKDLESPYMIMQGTYIPAILQTAINSDVPGLIRARVTRNVYDSASGRYLLVPQGTTLVGIYNSDVKYGDERAQIKFTRMIRPDGSSIILSAPPGMNDIGESGIAGDVDNHWGAVIGAGILGVLFNIPAILAENSANASSGQVCYSSDGTPYVCGNTTSSSVSTSAAQSLGQTSSQIGGKIADRSLNLKPTIRLPVGTLFSVFTRKDMTIPPYRGGA